MAFAISTIVCKENFVPSSKVSRVHVSKSGGQPKFLKDGGISLRPDPNGRSLQS